MLDYLKKRKGRIELPLPAPQAGALPLRYNRHDFVSVLLLCTTNILDLTSISGYIWSFLNLPRRTHFR